jgi:hypothetical protein
MSREAEIIEIGDDGSFDISTKTVKQQKVADVDYESFDLSAFHKLSNSELVEALKDSEYALFKTKNDLYWLIVKLVSGDSVEQLLASTKAIKINTTQQKHFDVPLPENVTIDVKTVKCNQCKELVTVSFEVSK